VTAPTIAAATRPSPIAAFGARDFRVFWSGFVVYCISWGIQTYGIGWLTVQIAARDGTPERGALYLGLLGLATAIPGLALGLFGGVLADRRDRRFLLIVSLGAFAATSLLLGVLTLIDRVGLAWLLVVSALLSIVASFWHPARIAIQPSLVGERRLMSAFGLNSFALNFGLLVGPLIGAAVIIPFGVGGVLIVPAVLYGIAALLCIGLAPQPVAHDARRTNVLASLIEGLRYVRDDPNVRWLMLLFAAGTLLVRPYADLLPALATSIGADAIGLAQLVAAVGGGSMLAGFVTASADAIPRKGVFVAGGFAAAGLTLAALAAQQEVLRAVALVALLSFFLMTASGIVGALLQYATPDRLRGRVVGVQGLLLGGGLPVGTLVLGALGSSVGIGPTLAVAGFGLAVFAIASVATVAVLRGR
jgi:hypothetical protein